LLFIFDSYAAFVTLYKFIALNKLKPNDNEQYLQLLVRESYEKVTIGVDIAPVHGLADRQRSHSKGRKETFTGT
jgi:hypothetical protein